MRLRRLWRGVVIGCVGLAGCAEPGGAATTAATGSSSTSSGPGASTGTSTGATAGEAPTTTTLTGGSGSGGVTTSGATTTTTTTTGAAATETEATSEGTTTTETTETGETTGTTGEPPGELLRLEHVQVKGTHNSYHVEPLIAFDASHEYTHAPLDVQLGSQGVRAFELDVHKGLSEFEVYHIAVIDAETTCSTLKDCLEVMQGWSLAHPQHLPIVVWIEIKDSTGGLPITAADLDLIDEVIRETLPPEQLFTPDDLQGGHASPRLALEAEGWPTLAEVRGQFIVVLLNVEDGHAANYTYDYTTLDGRAMFARATPKQFDGPWAAVAKLGIGDTEAHAQAHLGRFLIATNVCGAGEDDVTCTSSAAAAKAAGIHMLKDDFPAPVGGQAYFLDFPDGNPARCNPVTAPAECTSVALEDL